MQLEERVLRPVLAHRALDRRLYLEDEQVLRSAEREKPPVELQVRCRALVHRQSRFRATGDVDSTCEQLDAADLHRRVLAGDSANADSRPDGELERRQLETTRCPVSRGALDGRLDAPCSVL